MLRVTGEAGSYTRFESLPTPRFVPTIPFVPREVVCEDEADNRIAVGPDGAHAWS